MFDVKFLAAFVLAGLIVVGAAAAGLAQALGAHPFWDVKTALFGLVPGAIVALLLASRQMLGVVIALGATLLAYGVAYWGKAEFAASFAENTLAGQLWYFGWIATAGFATAALAVLVFSIWQQRR